MNAIEMSITMSTSVESNISGDIFAAQFCQESSCTTTLSRIYGQCFEISLLH